MINVVVGSLVVALALVIAVCMVTAGRATDHQLAMTEYRSRYRAARWLSCYNHASVAVLEGLLAKRAGFSYRVMRELVDSLLAKQPYYGALNQLIPLRLVPEELRNDAEVYNAAVLQHDWPSNYTAKGRYVETPDQSRVRQLGDALDVLTRAPTGQQLEDIAESTGVPLPYVKMTAEALRSRAEWDLLQILGTENDKLVTVKENTHV